MPATPPSMTQASSAPSGVAGSGAVRQADARSGSPSGAESRQQPSSGSAAASGDGTAPAAAQAPIAVPSGPLAFASRSGVPVNPGEWPEPWSGWFAKTAPAPVLWTYHELGADLTGIGRSPERSQFFKNLIGELRLPKGSSVFWPGAMPVVEVSGEAVLRADAALFAAGVSRLMPQIVIVFGENTLEDIGLAGKIQPLRQAMVEGKLLLCLPDIDSLLQSQGQRASSVPLLRAVLASANLS